MLAFKLYPEQYINPVQLVLNRLLFGSVYAGICTVCRLYFDYLILTVA